jgi:hypothetical protein
MTTYQPRPRTIDAILVDGDTPHDLVEQFTGGVVESVLLPGPGRGLTHGLRIRVPLRGGNVSVVFGRYLIKGYLVGEPERLTVMDAGRFEQLYEPVGVGGALQRMGFPHHPGTGHAGAADGAPS